MAHKEFDEEKFEDWLRTVNGGNLPTLGAVAFVRRLHFEAENSPHFYVEIVSWATWWLLNT